MSKKKERVMSYYLQNLFLLVFYCWLFSLVRSDDSYLHNNLSSKFYKSFLSRKHVIATDSPNLSEFKTIVNETVTIQGDSESWEENEHSVQSYLSNSSDVKMCSYPDLISNYNNNDGFIVIPCNESEYDIIDSFILLETPNLLEETVLTNDYDTSTSRELNPEDLLPDGCTFINTVNVQHRTVLCQGLNMTKVPIFEDLRNIDTLIFNHTGIQVLDKKSAERLPEVATLVFMNGMLMRVSYSDLLYYKVGLKNLTLINNSIYCLSFSSFFNANQEKELLEVLNLQHNSISNLPDSPVDKEPVLFSLQILQLGHNPMRVISGDFFYPLRMSKVKQLYLGDSSLYDFGKPEYEEGESPLIYLQHLELLDLSKNPRFTNEQLQQFTSALHNDSLKTLILDDNSLLEVPKAVLEQVKNTLEYLSMKGSSLYCLDGFAFPHMKKLRELHLEGSRISEINEGTFDPLSALEILHLDGNQLVYLPHAVSRPSLKKLFLKNNPNTYDDNDQIFAIGENSLDNSVNLMTLDFTEVPLKRISDTYFSNLTNLQNLQLSGCKITVIKDRSFQDLNSLRLLNLGQNNLRNVSQETFVGLYNLLYLDLSDNSLDFNYSNETEREINIPKVYEKANSLKNLSRVPLTVFNSVYRLKSLNLRGNNINFLVPEIFESFTQLREVDLSDNEIKSWYIPIFNNSDQLQIILLSQNKIENLTEAMIKDFSKPNLIVDLRDNMLNCSCSLLAFDNELNDTYFVRRDSYKCFHDKEYIPVDDYLREVYENDSCKKEEDNFFPPDPSKKMLIIGVMSGITIILLASSIAYYRNRWQLKYIAFKFRYQLRFSREYPDESMYEYDSFVCYAQDDRQWIMDKFVMNLENSCGLRVCIHERDFVAGEFITKNIVMAMETSRKIIIVITKAFIKSTWCMFELEMACTHTQGKLSNKLILVLLEPIPEKEQPKNLRNLLQSRTYLTWISDIEGEKLFWAKLVKVISKPIFNKEDRQKKASKSSKDRQKNVSESSESTTNLATNLSFASVDSSDFETENENVDGGQETLGYMQGGIGFQNPSFTLCNEVINFESVKNYYENKAYQAEEGKNENLDLKNPFNFFNTFLNSNLILEDNFHEFEV